MTPPACCATHSFPILSLYCHVQICSLLPHQKILLLQRDLFCFVLFFVFLGPSTFDSLPSNYQKHQHVCNYSQCHSSSVYFDSSFFCLEQRKQLSLSCIRQSGQTCCVLKEAISRLEKPTCHIRWERQLEEVTEPEC